MAKCEATYCDRMAEVSVFMGKEVLCRLCSRCAREFDYVLNAYEKWGESSALYGKMANKRFANRRYEKRGRI